MAERDPIELQEAEHHEVSAPDAEHVAAKLGNKRRQKVMLGLAGGMLLLGGGWFAFHDGGHVAWGETFRTDPVARVGGSHGGSGRQH